MQHGLEARDLRVLLVLLLIPSITRLNSRYSLRRLLDGAGHSTMAGCSMEWGVVMAGCSAVAGCRRVVVGVLRVVRPGGCSAVQRGPLRVFHGDVGDQVRRYRHHSRRRRGLCCYSHRHPVAGRRGLATAGLRFRGLLLRM